MEKRELNQVKQVIYYFVLGLSYLIVSACSGGDNNSNTSKEVPTPTPLNGTLDIPVQGLQYRTETLTGSTTTNGGYKYIEGEIITFHLGNTVFGSTLATQNIGFSDIVLIPAESSDTETKQYKAQGSALESIMPKPSYLYLESEILEAIRASEPNPQTTLINELMLLYSLDEDNNPKNGVIITTSTQQLFSEEVPLYFELPTHRFANEALYVMAQLDNTLFTPEAALAITYQTLNTPIRKNSSRPRILSTPLSFQEDNNGDGVYERKISYIYDTYDNIVAYEADYNDDDIPDFKWLSEKLVSGHTSITSIERDGNPSYLFYVSYDHAGRWIQTENKISANGHSKFITRVSYDEKGNRIEVMTDYGPDSTSNRIYKYKYDTNNQLIESSIDYNADGNLNQQTLINYLATGRIEINRDNINNNGIPSSQTTTTFDLFGNKTFIEKDFDGDGLPNQSITFSYDHNGNLLEETHKQSSDDTINFIKLYAYNSYGNTLTITEDNGNDGIIEMMLEYTYSEHQQLLSERKKDDEGNEITKLYTYDEIRNKSTFQYISTQDSSRNYTEHYTYNLPGYLTLVETDRHSNNSIDSVTTKVYDHWGNITQYEYDYNNDGIPDQSALIDWKSTTQINTENEISYAITSNLRHLSYLEFELTVH